MEKRTQWWKESKDDVAQAIFSTVRFLSENQKTVQESNLKAVRLYGNADMLGLSAFTFMSPSEPSRRANDSLKLNVVKSCVDTVCNKISKNKPKPFFLTDSDRPDAWSLQEKAKKLNLFAQGIFYQTKLYDIAPTIFRDACIFDTGGFLKIYRAGNMIKIDRVIPDEIKIDDVESFYGKPRQIHQVKTVDREVLLDAFKSKKTLIYNAKEATPQNSMRQSTADQVTVVESWRLPTSEGAKNGRHVISIENGTLVDEVWKKDFFPFAWMQWSQPLFGFRGMSLVGELAGIQYEINRILKTIQQILRFCVPKLMLEKGSKIAVQHLNNEIGATLEYTGTRPIVEAISAVPPDLFAQLDRLYSRAYEIVGVSALSAQSVKPSGLDSGKAIREFNDIESERFILKGLMYENFFMECTKQFISLAKDIEADGESFSVKVPGKKFLDSIEWSDIDLDEEVYELQSFPTSFLPQTPSGRFQAVQELVQAGFIDQEYAKDLLDFPDLENYMTLSNSSLQDIKRTIEMMLAKGNYQAPEPYQNLQLGIKLMQSAYLTAKNQKAPEDRLELMRRWMRDADAMMSGPQSAMEAQAQQGQPIAQPVQAPQSDLLPYPTANGTAQPQ